MRASTGPGRADRGPWSARAAFAGLLAAGCGLAPATLQQITDLGRFDDLPALCADVARAPVSPEGGRALGRLVAHWPAERRGKSWWLRGCRLRVDADGPGTFAGDYFDTLTPAWQFAVADLPHHRRSGVGAPLVGIRENRGYEAIERHYPPEGIVRPVTAVAETTVQDDGTNDVRVRLLSPLSHEDVVIEGRSYPLAADLTVPWVALLERAGPLRGSWLAGLTAARPKRPAQLYLMEPYDPRKEPLLLVHGLLATPIGWAHVTNDLWGDPEVRRRYQIWHYHYPTSAPFLYSAKIFRDRIDEARRLAEPPDGVGAPPMTVIAHSMGGLLTKTLITDSGNAVWETVFTRPVDALRGRADDRATVDAILHWRARPDVRRVIFIAVPHRGSDLSGALLGRLGDRLAGVPSEFTATYARLHRDNPGALTPRFERALSQGRLSSIDTLAPDHPLLPVLNARPIAPWVAIHSVIGDRGQPGPLAASSDGIVPYTSSHLEGVDSELVVPADHAVYRDPAAVAEIRRALLLPDRAAP